MKVEETKMKEKNLMQENINGKEWLEEYIKILSGACSDFPEVKTIYENACKELRQGFKDIDKIIEYTNNMLISSLEFSFEQGLNDNLEHFKNPNKPTFLDNDYDEALKESKLRTKSDYIEASTKLKEYIDLMPNKLWPLYDVMIEYRAFLEAYIPKMAHYYGFTTANKTLKNIIKDYEPDLVLTQRYREWLNVYLDLRLE